MNRRTTSILLCLALVLATCGWPQAARAAADTPTPGVALPALVVEPIEGLDGGEGPGFLRHHTELATAGPLTLAVWQQRPFWQDGGYRIFARWLRQGRPVGLPVALTPEGRDEPWDPAAAVTPAGQAVVVWTRSRPEAPNLIEGVWGRMDGPWHPFTVDSPDLDTPRGAKVAVLSDDAFVVVWRGVARSGRLGLAGRVFRRGEKGFLAGEPFAIGEGMEIVRPEAAVAAGAGGFEVVWAGRRDREEAMVWSRRFDAAGVAVGAASPLGRLERPEGAMAILSIGPLGYAASWVESTPEGRTIRLRSLDIAGEASRSAVTIVRSDDQVFDGPMLAADGAGRLLVSWTSPSAASGKIEIRGVLWDQGADLPIAPPFALATQGTGNTAWPALTGGTGSFLLVWSGLPGLIGRSLTYRSEGAEPRAASAVDCTRRSASVAVVELDRAMARRGPSPILLRPLDALGGWAGDAAGPVEGGRAGESLRAELPAPRAGECASGSQKEDRARIDWLSGRLVLYGDPLPFALAVYRAEGVASFAVEAFYRGAGEESPSTLRFELSFDLLTATAEEHQGLLQFLPAGRDGDAALPGLAVELMGARPTDEAGEACAATAPPCPSEYAFTMRSAGRDPGPAPSSIVRSMENRPGLPYSRRLLRALPGPRGGGRG